MDTITKDNNVMNNSTKVDNAENNRTLRREKINAFIRYVVLGVVGLMMLYPLLWMFTAALKPNHEIFTSMSLIPKEWSLEGFING